MKTNQRIAPILFAVAAAAVAAVTLPSCGDKDGGPSAGPSELGPSQRSKHFDAVSSHLDLGGEVYAYIDIDGDLDKLASIADDFVGQIRRAAGPDVPPELAAFSMKDMPSDLGLSGIGALGMSSYKNGDLYRNKYYLHTPNGREGMLKIFGGEAAPFAVRKLAPSGTDLVFEQDLDLKSVFEMVGTLARKYGGAQAAAEFRKATSEPMPGAGLTMADIFGSLDTKIIMIGQIDPARPLDLPQEVPVKIPDFDLLIAVEGIGSVVTKFTDAIPPAQRQQMIKDGDGYEEMVIPMPPEMRGIMGPVIRHEKESGRILFATSAEYLEECLSGKSSVWDDEGFKAATEGLPEEGNGISYASAEFFKEYLRIYGDMFKMMSAQGEMPVGVGEMVIGLMADLGLSPDHAQARVIANLPEGILIAENAAVSAKQGVVAAGVAVVGVMAATAVPAYQQAERQAYETEAAALEALESELRESRNREDNPSPPAVRLPPGTRLVPPAPAPENADPE